MASSSLQHTIKDYILVFCLLLAFFGRDTPARIVYLSFANNPACEKSLRLMKHYYILETHLRAIQLALVRVY